MRKFSQCQGLLNNTKGDVEAGRKLKGVIRLNIIYTIWSNNYLLQIIVEKIYFPNSNKFIFTFRVNLKQLKDSKYNKDLSYFFPSTTSWFIGWILKMISGTGSIIGCTCNSPTFRHVSRRNCMHLGHDEFSFSHLLMQRIWKPWLHLGNMCTFSLFVNSERHIAHSISKLGSFKSVA